jgi:hypothetical protein
MWTVGLLILFTFFLLKSGKFYSKVRCRPVRAGQKQQVAYFATPVHSQQTYLEVAA